MVDFEAEKCSSTPWSWHTKAVYTFDDDCSALSSVDKVLLISIHTNQESQSLILITDVFNIVCSVMRNIRVS